MLYPVELWVPTHSEWYFPAPRVSTGPNLSGTAREAAFFHGFGGTTRVSPIVGVVSDVPPINPARAELPAADGLTTPPEPGMVQLV